MRLSVPIRSALSMDVFFFNDTATTEIYTLSLHDALPIYFVAVFNESIIFFSGNTFEYLIETLDDSSHKKFFNVPKLGGTKYGKDRKSTRLNSSHANISYAVFCLKKTKACDTR